MPRKSGWQKPVAPPNSATRPPGGLPPKPPLRVVVEMPTDETTELARALAWALYWIARHGIVPVPDGTDDAEWESWAEARRLVKAMGADR